MRTFVLAAVAGIAGVAIANAQTSTTPSATATGTSAAPAAGADAASSTAMPTTTTKNADGSTTTTTAGGTSGAMPAGTDASAGAAGASAADSTAAAGSTSGDTAKSAAMADMSAQDFVTKAASGGMFEVQSSEMALKRSKSDEVKKFAQMMIDDHTKANDELKSIAGDKKLEVPSEPQGGPADHMKAVSDASDDDFDKTYIEHQQKAHAETIDLFEAEAASNNDPALADFAKKTIPTLKMHAEHAQMLKM